MKIFFGVIIPILLVLVHGCSSPEKKIEEKSEKDSLSTLSLALLQQQCFACHSPEPNAPNTSAPSMAAVRNAYYQSVTGREGFLKSMIQFLDNPKAENSKMPESVAQYGLMPKMSFKESELQLIAAYLYENELESKEWLAQWEAFKKKPVMVQTDTGYLAKGQNLANATKTELGKNLLAAINAHGAAGAVEFCNTRALPITDSMSKVLQAHIRRVSDKPRNLLNAANAAELEFIAACKDKVASGAKATPKVTEYDGKAIGYYPIITGAMCLQCHGHKGTDIENLTLEKINRLYPADKATGYGENEVRGLYVVEMSRGN